MLGEIAIADAYGAGFEFSPKDKVALKNNLSEYQKHELYNIKGKYTDDTQLSIAISEVLLEHEAPCKQDFAQKFLDCFKRDPREGYSKGFYEILKSVKDGKKLIQVLNPNSTRNGAAIRSIPLGYLNTIEKTRLMAEVQASITHNTRIGILSSITVAVVAHYAIHCNLETAEIPKILVQHGLDIWDLNWSKEVSVDAFDTVSAALTCLINNKSTSRLLLDCVNLCGDTDSVAAIAIGLGSCFHEYCNDLPKALIDGLDEPTYGITFLDNLEEELIKKFRR